MDRGGDDFFCVAVAVPLIIKFATANARLAREEIVSTYFSGTRNHAAPH
jgi:hypothetical protein